jgi:hypothetical protein
MQQCPSVILSPSTSTALTPSNSSNLTVSCGDQAEHAAQLLATGRRVAVVGRR